MYEQLIAPRLSTRSNAGWCLWQTQEDFGVPHLYDTARIAYYATVHRHEDRKFPTNSVYITIYLSHKATYDGIYQDWGHYCTLRTSDGHIFTSPIKVAYGIEEYESLDGFIATVRSRGMHIEYVGWTEDLSGKRIVKPKEDEMTAAELQKHNLGVAFSKLKRLGEGALVVRAKLPSTKVWRLDTEPDWKSGFTYKKGDEFEVVAYVDTNGTRYYVSAPDALNGKPWGVNRNDVEIVGPVAPPAPAEFEELKQTVYVKKK